MWIKMYILLRRALDTKIQDYNASSDIFETPVIWDCSDYLNIRNSLLHSWKQIIMYCIVDMPFQAHYGGWDETLKNQSLHIYTMTDTRSWQKKKRDQDAMSVTANSTGYLLLGSTFSFAFFCFCCMISASLKYKIIFTFSMIQFVIQCIYLLLFSLGVVPLLTGSCWEAILISLPFGLFILLLSILLTGKLTLISPCRTRHHNTVNGLFMLYSLEYTKIADRTEHEVTR